MDKTSDFHLILDLLAFGFILNTVFRWTKKLRKDLFEPWDFIEKISSAVF